MNWNKFKEEQKTYKFSYGGTKAAASEKIGNDSSCPTSFHRFPMVEFTILLKSTLVRDSTLDLEPMRNPMILCLYEVMCLPCMQA